MMDAIKKVAVVLFVVAAGAIAGRCAAPEQTETASRFSGSFLGGPSLPSGADNGEQLIYANGSATWAPVKPSEHVYSWISECDNVGATQGEISLGASGGTTTLTGDVGHPGICNLNTSTSSTGNARSITSQTAYLFDSTTTWTSEIMMNLSALSTVAQEYVAQCGFLDVTVGDQQDGAYFEYSRITTGNDKWRIVVASNSTRTKQTLDGTSSTVDSNISAGDWDKLKVVCTSARCDFYIDGTAVGSACSSGCSMVATNIPSGAGRQTAIGCQMTKTAGTTSVTLAVDYHKAYALFPTAR